MKSKNLFFWFIFSVFYSSLAAAEKTIIRLGILPFGTVNWELTALQDMNLDDKAHFKLDIQHVANPQAGKIALQAGAVDMIVSDWIWVSRLRTEGSDYTFYPYSSTSGSLVVADSSMIKSIQDLKGTRLGIAGGELDKNWLLLQALALKQYQLDLNQSVEKVYAAPPLLNEQILQGRVEAVMNYWHFAARLESQGYRQIINGKQILEGLGITASVPTLGYVFNQGWANQNKKAVNDFLQAAKQSKELLCSDDAAWNKIIPLTRAKQESTQKILRKSYCEGRINSWGTEEQKAASQIYSLLKNLSNGRLTGPAKDLQPGTFW